MMKRSLAAFASMLGVLLPSVAQGAAGTDLSVSITAPASIRVYESASYLVKVANLGAQRSDGASVTIQLPETDTSPSVYLLGTLGQFDPRCSRSGAQLTCATGALAPKASTELRFELALPESSKSLSLQAAVEGAGGDPNAANNLASQALTPSHFGVALTGPVALSSSRCTGTTLSSYFECTVTPTVLERGTLELAANGSVRAAQASALSGSWNQPSPDRLRIAFAAGDQPAATFEGYGVSEHCFEGSLSSEANAYVSVQRLCFAAKDSSPVASSTP